jgi:O-acetyl-ADP-ribose deacetylase (regulator of RNase III)
VPPRALWLRALFLERERIANHLGDLGYLGNDAALSFGLAQFLRLKEDWLRLNAELFGHRFLMDAIVPGGVAVDLPAGGAARLLAQGEAIGREVRVLRNIYDEHAGLQDRFITTGRLRPQLAAELGVSGLAGRASGQPWDLRRQKPIAPYDALDVQIATHRNGDVAARVTLRFDEVFESLRLIRAIVDGLPEGVAALTAGIDAAAVGFFGDELMRQIQFRIMDEYLGEQPVGTAFIHTTGNPHIPFLAHAPTMRVPCSIEGTDKVYASTWAAFVAAHAHNVDAEQKIETIAFPAMGTGFGGVSFDEAARQMAAAYHHYLHPPMRLDWDFVVERQKAITYDGSRQVVR